MVSITALSENTSSREELGCEHGLSLYIETPKDKLLFDMGASGLFLKNAEKLGVNIAGVEAAFLSHGHYDHGGGLPFFLEANQKAPVYVSEYAFEEHFGAQSDGSAKYIGLPKELVSSPRIVKLKGDAQINEDLSVLSGASGKDLFSGANALILMMENGKLVPDDFRHEQSLVIKDGDNYILIAGCAHSGIVNILRRFEEKYGRVPDYVVGGFHLSSPATGGSEPPELLDAVAERLLSKPCRYATCHCTGQKSYAYLKELMGDKLRYLAAGDTIRI